jgi:RimJ/RimL family protein N-acetyltransferase
MKSIGCTVEGVLRQNYILPDETRRDSIILSILRSEWEKYVKDKLFKKL